MGGVGSTRWQGYPKATTIEECPALDMVDPRRKRERKRYLRKAI